MSKRRLINLLPGVHQTDTLKRFFGATVDQVFQPGNIETISGYIGRKPSYYDPSTDFYKIEPSAARAAYQLEPAMVSLDDTNTATAALFYEDFINHLAAHGAITTNQPRLFEADYYSWAPPIDIDKMVNYQLYYWVEYDTAAVTLRHDPAIYVSNASTTTFALPGTLAGLTAADETVKVFLNGVETQVFTRDGQNIVFPSASTAGTEIRIYRYGDLAASIAGKASVNLSGMTSDVTALSSGMRVRIIDATDRIMFVDGVGSAIAFSADLGDHDPSYVVIDRRSRERSPWATRNRWAHRDAINWAGLNTSARQAKRPIIEFVPNLKLYNYGETRLDDITCLMTRNAYQGSTSVPFASINGLAYGTVAVDGGHVLVEGDRLLVFISGLSPSLNNRVYEVGKIVDGSLNEFYVLNAVSTPTYGQTVRLPERGNVPFDLTAVDAEPWEYNSAAVEFWYNGSTWVQAQADSAEPLFMLYDGDGNALDDPGLYPDSEFAGSRLFGFAVGTGSADSVVGLPLKKDSYGQIIFEVDLSTRRIAYRDGEIPGYYYYGTADEVGDLAYLNGWYLAPTTITQTIVDGTPGIPLNLQANPDHEEPGFMSRNQWFEHFASILENQVGFDGEAYSANNWRDGPRDLSRGESIVQHRAPLLKAMLLAADGDFSFIDAARFVEAHYIRFRNKFIQKIVEFHSDGTLSESDAADTWVTAILDALRANKNGEFSFALSTIAGGQYFVPPTPAALGIYPSTPPAIEIDSAFEEPVTFIRGHDGSRVPAFDDFRDDILLALEDRIYNSIPAKFRNNRPAFDVATFMSGKFRTDPLSYGREEVTRVLAPQFERWAQTNGLDYRDHDEFDPDNPFTWNFSSVLDRDGDSLPGSWRGIYLHYFDTERPHEVPWEMLGFTAKPSWWEAQYGPAPYTRGNTDMWTDIANGYIASGLNQGVNPLYVRPNLLAVLPVDDNGDLLDPIEAGIVTNRPIQQAAAKPWSVGDCGPVEMLWRISPSYRFALAMAGYLLKPARFVEDCWNTDTRLLQNGQWLDSGFGKRPRHADLVIHGETVDDEPVSVNGIQQWIVEMMIDRGQTPARLGDAVRGLGVRLGHKMAGFTSKEHLRVTAENFGLVPDEDIVVALYRSPPIKSEFYSGVLIERVDDGWRVIGYNPNDSVFTIMPADPNGPKTKFSVVEGALPHVVAWRPGVRFVAGALVQYEQSIYRCAVEHMSAASFEQQFWSAAPEVARLLNSTTSILKYSKANGTVSTVSYGTTFATRQDVADFLFAYERWLKTRGWVFDKVEDNRVNDWSAAVREFLQWAEIDWAPGNFIALSPLASEAIFNTEHGSILDIDAGSYSIIDRTGLPINRRDTVVDRLDGEVKVRARNADIYGLRVQVIEIEHALLFSNETIFKDIIYQPIYNLRQQRLRISAKRAPDWTGRLDAPGYILIDNEIKPNFEQSAEDIRTMFDIERASNATLRDHARHVIGYQSRDYLSKLGMSETQQFEFYQGMIQQKGAVGSFGKILRSNAVGQSRDIRFFEEWAFRLGSYGANNPRTRYEFSLFNSDIRRQPQFVHFREGDVLRPDWVQFAPNDSRWIERSTAPNFPLLPVNTEAPEALPTAGYTRTTEIEHFAFGFAELSALYEAGREFAVGDSILVHVTENLDWMAYRLRHLSSTGAANRVTLVETNAEDATVLGSRLTFALDHGLTTDAIGSYILINEMPVGAPAIAGFKRIIAVGSQTLEIEDESDIGYDFADYDVEGPEVFLLVPVRFPNIATRDAAVPTLQAADGDIVYVDDSGDGSWAAYMKTTSGWIVKRRQPRRVDSAAFAGSLIYDLDTKLSKETIAPKPLVLDYLTVVDPVAGLIPGIAEREIDYKLEYDPARYEGGREWGGEHVGEIWWDLSTVRFIDCNTDEVHDLAVTDPRYVEEIEYRIGNWGRIAEGTTVTLYEWTRSELAPFEWLQAAEDDKSGAYAGSLPNGISTRFVTREEADPVTGHLKTFYYFWIGNRSAKPDVPFRKRDAASLARILANPTGEDFAWLAPITSRGLLLGGAAPYLDNPSPVIQFEIVETNYDGPEHIEWSLVRPSDENSPPPETLWRKMADSLVGFDRWLRPVPDTTLHASNITGINDSPRQNMFGDAAKVKEARKSFVQMVNYILGRTPVVTERPAAIGAMSRETPLAERLFWTQADGSRFIETIPPKAEWEHRLALTPEQRDRYLTTREFAIALGAIPYDGPEGVDTTGWDYDLSEENVADLPRLRVLLDRTSSATPQWSVWELDTTIENRPSSAADALARANEFFVPAKTYDYDVANIAQRDALKDLADPIRSGQRVLVRGTSETSGFWTIWRYEPDNLLADAAGFVMTAAQTYRTDDFWFYADWYADGYSASSPPLVEYPNMGAFNLAQEKGADDVFVSVADGDGNGGFHWLALVDGQWVVVAREDGTIQLSERLYGDGPVYGWANGDYHFDLDDIEDRDGTFELRVLIDSMRDGGVLTDLEINELWFSIVHHVHAMNDEVDWGFKTSFMSVAGYNEPLRATPVEQPDNSEALLSYLEEVKPYRVKIRDFVRTLTPDTDVAGVNVTELDRQMVIKMVWDRVSPVDIPDGTLAENFDSNDTSLKVALNPASTVPFTVPSSEPGVVYIGGEKIEYMNIAIADGIATLTNITRGTVILPHYAGDAVYSGSPSILSATARIMNFYQPEGSMAAKSLDTLLKLDFKGTVLDGSTLLGLTSEWGISGYDLQAYDQVNAIARDVDIDGAGDEADIHINATTETGQPGYGLVDPVVNPNRPPELASMLVTDTLRLRVIERWTAGTPSQKVKVFDTSRRTAASGTFEVPSIAQSSEGIIVFRDGIRANLGTDFTPNHLDRKVSVNLTHPDASRVQKVEVHAFGSASATTIVSRSFFSASSQTDFTVADAENYSVEVVANGVRLPVADYSVSGDTVALDAAVTGSVMIVLHMPGAAAEPAASVNVESFTYSGTASFVLADPSTVPGAEPAATIVEVNGLRLTPPETHYVVLADTPVIELNAAPSDPANVKIWVGGMLHGQPLVTGFTSVEDAQASPQAGRFGIYDRFIISLDSTMTNEAIIEVYENHDYTVEAGTLTVLSSLSNGDTVTATTFRKGAETGMRTRVLPSNPTGEYDLPANAATNRSWITLNGRRLTPEQDYEIGSKLKLSTPIDATDKLVMTLFLATEAREPRMWQTSTIVPDIARLRRDGDDWVLQEGAWERIGFDPLRASALLAEELTPTSAQIVLTLNPINIPASMLPSQPIPVPDPANNKPGVIWIDHERIEYFGHSRDGSTVTLSELRRGTRGTSGAASIAAGALALVPQVTARSV